MTQDSRTAPSGTPTSGLPTSKRADLHRSPSAGGRLGLWVWVLAGLVLLVDQLSKVWAVSALIPGERTAILGDLFGIVLVRNPGAAFSMASGQTWIFAIAATAVIAWIIWATPRLKSRLWVLAAGLMLGGALGNLGDRLFRAPGVLRGHVVDFLDYGGFFVGNLADIAIVGSSILVMVLVFLGIEADGTRSNAGRGKDQGEPKDSGEGPASGTQSQAETEVSEQGQGEGSASATSTDLGQTEEQR